MELSFGLAVIIIFLFFAINREKNERNAAVARLAGQLSAARETMKILDEKIDAIASHVRAISANASNSESKV